MEAIHTTRTKSASLLFLLHLCLLRTTGAGSRSGSGRSPTGPWCPFRVSQLPDHRSLYVWECVCHVSTSSYRQYCANECDAILFTLQSPEHGVNTNVVRDIVSKVGHGRRVDGVEPHRLDSEEITKKYTDCVWEDDKLTSEFEKYIPKTGDIVHPISNAIQVAHSITFCYCWYFVLESNESILCFINDSWSTITVLERAWIYLVDHTPTPPVFGFLPVGSGFTIIIYDQNTTEQRK